MRKTNCRTMTRMMSLYVAGDLVGEPEREAAAHLAACQACRQLAEEFSESSSLLTQAFAPPEFGAEFYTGIRRAVLGKITDDGIASKPPLFERLWARRWVYAGALAAVVIAIVMLQVFRRIPHEPQNLGFTPQVTRPSTLDQTREANSSSSRQLSGSPRKPDRATAQTGKSHQLFARMDSRRSNSQIEAAKKPDAQDTLSGWSASSPSAVASSSEISRIEMQTADPNIRIIWFAPREFRKSEETDHDQDPESGDRN